MTKTALVAAVVAALALPTEAFARKVSIQTTLTPYGGKGAYLAIYLVDAAGKFHSTLHVAGGKSKYYSHLRDWSRGRAGANQRIDGTTGASVGSGRMLTVSAEIADSLIDAGYQIRVDTSVEHGSDNAADVVAPLAAAAAGKPLAAKGYVKSFKFDM